jgi:hypothetical protein
MTTDPTDGKLGLRIESAASVILRDVIKKHMQTFAHVIRDDRAANASVVAVYVDGLAGALALTIAGGHASRDAAVELTLAKLRDSVERDLKHLRRS